MNKYKKIFSGLGLLSISTLIGASVVACANKKPKASDSSTEAIDQNNNQGNSTTPEQEKPEMPQNPAPGTDHNNQEKPETPKEGTPAPNAPSTPTPEMLKTLQNKMVILVKVMTQKIIHKMKIKAKQVKMIQNKKINQLLHHNYLDQKLQLKQNQWNY
ncbi:hypothetical protein ONA24_03560 [Mycoplasmopsis cynos]|uniref:Vmc-like lipoprotein signal peptide domain-containing protein n=1 Tax=Mycoplasmopsis cynos TaxID=171284 RepID=UPI0024CAB8A4|nr:hypothetical protein [Mycoplasmopsis cynos]WAM10312.1 hypothetical protein ONA24_03560 [Mycoplasmopsis cynos]